MKRVEPIIGETLAIAERLVVAPKTGILDGAELALDSVVEPGEIVGWVVGPGLRVPVISPFAGVVAGRLTRPGWRVRAGEAIAWLRPVTIDQFDSITLDESA